MRSSLLIGAIVVAATLACSTIVEAGKVQWRGQLEGLGGSTMHGTVSWEESSEMAPLILNIKGAEPSSVLDARICGLSATTVDGNVYYGDMCWATFVERERHILDFTVDAKGKADLQLMPKLGVGPTGLVTPERVEVSKEGQVIAVAELKEKAVKQ